MRIMFLGKQRAGKDTAADFLVKEYGFVKIPLAKKLYWVAKELFDMKEKDRDLLIKLGAKLREIDENIFIKQVLKEAEYYKNVVVPDVRFVNEYIILKEYGFIPVRIIASKEVRKQRKGYNEQFENHYTEVALEPFPVYMEIINETTFDNLYIQLGDLIHKLWKEGR